MIELITKNKNNKNKNNDNDNDNAHFYIIYYILFPCIIIYKLNLRISKFLFPEFIY